MIAVLAFSITLVVAILVSGLTHRTILSNSVLFIVAGFIVGVESFHLVELRLEDPLVRVLVELALISVLFSDGLKVGLRDVLKAWHLPGRALFLGMPLTLLFIALLARLLLGLSWQECFLVAAVLSPTDPVFASAILNKPAVPDRLKTLLGIESGLNDGLALPIVLAMLAIVAKTHLHFSEWLLELGLGILFGIAIPWLLLKIKSIRLFGGIETYESLFVLAIALVLYAMAELTRANLFLSFYTAGITIATLDPDLREKFMPLGELLAELLKFLGLFLFGAVLSIPFLLQTSASTLIFASAVLLVARPLAVEIALLGSGLKHQERLAAGWFGPKGFASVVYGLIVLAANIPNREVLFHIIAVVILGSIIAHSSTDVLIARSFRTEPSRKS